MVLRVRYLEGVDPRLKAEMGPYIRWLREWYSFPVPLEIRLIGRSPLIDDDGTECYLRWWQHGSERPVFVEITVGHFEQSLSRAGPETTYSTIAGAIGRGVKHYIQAIRDAPERGDYAERWGARVVEAYVDEVAPPEPWKGAWVA